MKKIVLSIAAALLSGAINAQSPVPSYTNTAPNSVPGNPSQPAELYQGTHPAGGDNSKSTINIPDPAGAKTAPPNTYYQPNPNGSSNQTNQGGSQTNPSGSYPTAPSPTNQVNRLFQDPMKTSKYPNSDPPVRSPDGSSGKYKKNHKSVNGHNFANHHSHIKKAKKSDNGDIKGRKSSKQ